MKPVIALVGRPNVGKSTLFNRLTRTKNALVANIPGLTRDRQYGLLKTDDQDFIIIDTGGLSLQESGIDEEMANQSLKAIEEADLVLFLVDARQGLTAIDSELSQKIRHFSKPCMLVINKVDGVDENQATSEFYQLGMKYNLSISASHGRGVVLLKQQLSVCLSESPETTKSTAKNQPELTTKGTKIAIVGRPNVGKSTLVNRLLGEDRVIVYDHPGTTRDSIYIPYERHGREYTLIDTAGVRRRAKVDGVVEKFSVIKTLDAISDADVVVLMIDARDGIVEQDLHLLGTVIDSGRALVLAVNKWDGLEIDEKNQIKKELERRLVFIDYAELHFISALHGSGVGLLYKSIDKAHQASRKDLNTRALTEVLADAVATHAPPMINGRRIKLKFAHQGATKPPSIIIHGNQTESLPKSYIRYLEKTFRQHFKLFGTPIRLEFKSSDNPYKGKKNTLTARQQIKRKRMITHIKKNK